MDIQLSQIECELPTMGLPKIRFASWCGWLRYRKFSGSENVGEAVDFVEALAGVAVHANAVDEGEGEHSG